MNTDSEDGLEKMFLEQLQINKENLGAGFYLAAMMNVNSDQIILLEGKDSSSVEELKISLEKALDAQIRTWEQYLPDQYEKVKNNVIEINGNYLLYVTYENPEAIVDIFNKHTK